MFEVLKFVILIFDPKIELINFMVKIYYISRVDMIAVFEINTNFVFKCLKN